MQNRAYIVRKSENGKITTTVDEIPVPVISKNEVLIKSSYSSVNFKDALSSVGNPGVTRNFPHVTGIDVVGVIEQSSDALFKKGDEVLVTGYDMGMNSDGGHQNYVKVPVSWVVKKPENITDREIMMYGTAGLTAGLSVYELLKNGITKNSGEILVTGATGGVGTIAISILNKLGFEIVAISGKEEQIPFLKSIGAKEVILREDFDRENKKPMMKERFAGVIDTVGGNILSEALKCIKYDGVATCCGLTASFELNTNVFPFILRGVRLIGIDSVECTLEKKLKIWNKLADEFKITTLEKLSTEIALEDLPNAFKMLLDGKSVGRYLVKL